MRCSIQLLFLLALNACGEFAPVSEAQQAQSDAKAVLSDTRIGSYATLEGTVTERAAEAGRPAGLWLQLDRPIATPQGTHHQVFLGSRPASLAPGDEPVQLYGHLNAHAFEGEAMRYLSLTGICNVGAGEPGFDGASFTGVDGSPLTHLVLQSRASDTAQVLVAIDGDRAFVGLLETSKPKGTGAFSGILAALELASLAGGASVKVLPNPELEGGRVLCIGDSDGARQCLPLEMLTPVQGHDGKQPHTDQLVSTWFYEASSGTIYLTQSGGIAGFVHQVTRSIALPEDLRPTR